MKRFTLLTLILVFLGFTAITSADAQDKNLHEPYDKVLKEYVSNGMVDYAKMKKNRSSLDTYLTKLAGIDKK